MPSHGHTIFSTSFAATNDDNVLLESASLRSGGTGGASSTHSDYDEASEGDDDAALGHIITSRNAPPEDKAAVESVAGAGVAPLRLDAASGDRAVEVEVESAAREVGDGVESLDGESDAGSQGTGGVSSTHSDLSDDSEGDRGAALTSLTSAARPAGGGALPTREGRGVPDSMEEEEEAEGDAGTEGAGTEGVSSTHSDYSDGTHDMQQLLGGPHLHYADDFDSLSAGGAGGREGRTGVHFPPEVVSDVFLTRYRYSPEEVAELFYSNDDTVFFSSEYEKEYRHADLHDTTWYDYMLNRPDPEEGSGAPAGDGVGAEARGGQGRSLAEDDDGSDATENVYAWDDEGINF